MVIKSQQNTGYGCENHFIRDASIQDIDSMISVIGDYYSNLGLDTPSLKNEPPWCWMSDPAISSKILSSENEICGFFISRNLKKNTHLHSFFIKFDYYGKGLGTILLDHYHKDAISKNPSIETFTLHLHSKNNFAERFYIKRGYGLIMQTKRLLEKNDGFGEWARNCKDKDRWPLRRGLRLFGVNVFNLKKINSY